MSERPGIGDKVRVTYEGVVERSNGAEFTLGLGSGATYTHMFGSDDNVEVVERVKPKVIEVSREDLLTRREQLMETLRMNASEADDLDRIDFLLGWPPEAVRQPLVVNHGDREPHRDRTYRSVVEDATYGTRFVYTWAYREGDGWYWTDNADGYFETDGFSWAAVEKSYCNNFPMVEIVASTPTREAAEEITADSAEPDRSKTYRANDGWDWAYDGGWLFANRNTGFVSAQRFAWSRVRSSHGGGFPWRVKAS